MRDINKINAFLKQGNSISEYEKLNGFGKDTLRKWLNRNGYRFDKNKKIYVLQNETDSVIKKNISAYNIKTKDLKTKEVPKKMTLEEFKKLKTREKVTLINKFADGKMTLNQIAKNHFGFTNIGKYIPNNEAYWDGAEKKYKLINNFSDEEFLMLQEMIKCYKNKKEINNNDFEGEVIVRSVRTYKNILDSFAEYCKNNNLKQTDALAQALKNYMEQ